MTPPAAAQKPRDRVGFQVKTFHPSPDLAKAMAQCTAVDGAMSEQVASQELADLRPKREAAQTDLRRAEETIATCDAVLAGIPMKLAQLEAHLFEAVATLKPLAKAFRHEVIEALSAEYLEAFRVVERLFPRLFAYTNALQLPLLAALNGVDIPHPSGQGKYVCQGAVWDCSDPQNLKTASLSTWRDDPALVSQYEELAELVKLEDQVRGYFDVLQKRKHAEREAANREAADRAFMIGRPVPVNVGASGAGAGTPPAAPVHPAGGSPDRAQP